MKTTVCECGKKLTDGQIARGGKYCCSSHAGRYGKRKPAERGFGLEVPTTKRQACGPGFQAYINSRGGTSGEHSRK